MCGIVGFTNFRKNINNPLYVLNNMKDTLSKRGPDEEGIYSDNDKIFIAHKRLIVIDPTRRQTTYDYYIRRKRILYYL